MLGDGNNLGPMDSDGTPALTYRHSIGKMQAKATLNPAGIQDVVRSGWHMKRKKTTKGYTNGVQTRLSGVDEDDTSDAPWVDEDPKSGTSTQEIYDLDAPGCNIVGPGTTVNRCRGRIRMNFKQYVTVTLDSELPCSDEALWSYRAQIDADKASGKVEVNELKLSHITIPTSPHYSTEVTESC